MCTANVKERHCTFFRFLVLETIKVNRRRDHETLAHHSPRPANLGLVVAFVAVFSPSVGPGVLLFRGASRLKLHQLTKRRHRRVSLKP